MAVTKIIITHSENATEIESRIDSTSGGAALAGGSDDSTKRTYTL
jgi:hypothetical protein